MQTKKNKKVVKKKSSKKVKKKIDIIGHLPIYNPIWTRHADVECFPKKSKEAHAKTVQEKA